MKLNKKGFTLTEVIVVLVIVIIAAVIAVPNVVGWVNAHKRQNCTARLETLLSEIESNCASKRFLTADAVSANIISTASEFDERVKNTTSNNHGVTLFDFCDDKNDVRLSWNIEKQEEKRLFSVTVKAECEDGIDSENSFSCGLKEEVEYSDKTSLISSIVSQVINADKVKEAYKNADINLLAAEISKASNVNITEFAAAKEYVSSLSFTNEKVKMNTAMSMFLTVVVNNNDSYLNVFTGNFMGKDYMPAVVFSGNLKNDIYDSEVFGFSNDAFMLFGSRDMDISEYFSSDNIFINGDTVEFNVNCVWSVDFKTAYYLSVYESDGKPNVKKASEAKSNYLTSSEWVNK